MLPLRGGRLSRSGAERQIDQRAVRENAAVVHYEDVFRTHPTNRSLLIAVNL